MYENIRDKKEDLKRYSMHRQNQYRDRQTVSHTLLNKNDTDHSNERPCARFLEKHIG